LAFLLQGPLSQAECLRDALAAQNRFGFQAGDLIQGDEHAFMIQHVTAGGLFDKAGVRAGDVPVQFHPGLDLFCYALDQATAGKASELTVINVQDLADGWQRARVITIDPPSPR
jgi:hypothetical protein